MIFLAGGLDIIARAGGGGSSGGGGAGGILVLPFIIGAAILAWWRRRKQIKKAEAKLKVAEAKDADWDENVLSSRTIDVFNSFQADWSQFNLDGMKKYLTPTYFQHMALVLQALKQLHRQNDVRDPRVIKATLFNVDDEADNNKDNFDVEVKAKADDCLIDTNTNKLLYQDKSSFTEIWHFDRLDQAWMLDDIEQTEGESSAGVYDAETAIEKGYVPKAELEKEDRQAAKMADFADKNDFFYNADFGHLLMPNEGVLFTAASFGRSDINYHVIGLYKDVLVQFYQYVPFPDSKRTLKDYFLSIYKPYYSATQYYIAQTVLPKTYGDIIVQHKSHYSIRFTPRGMQRVKLEWPEFNSKYDVFATDPDKITSLELLDPTYMEKLFAVDFPISLQLVGNNLYMYTVAPAADFEVMLDLLKQAFTQMKM